MSEKLKPCPFCGLIPNLKFKKYGKGLPDEAYIYHDSQSCGVTIKTSIYRKKESAIKAWNTRKSLSVEDIEEIINSFDGNSIIDGGGYDGEPSITESGVKRIARAIKDAMEGK